MKKTALVVTWIFAIAMTACAPAVPSTQKSTVTPVPLPATETVIPVETQTPVPAAPTEVEPPAEGKSYINSAFGLGFRTPSGWFGPEEYVADQTLRVEIGSDQVYPYGTDRTEQIHTVKNAYFIVIQYTKNDQNQVWNETYQVLANLKDGESVSTARSLIIRERQVELGRFKGFEYISTLSENAQTEPVYSRQILLVDDQSNVLTISGNPNNVEVGDGSEWRDVYRSIDEANRAHFHEIAESLTIE